MKVYLGCLALVTLATLSHGVTVEETCAVVKDNTYIGTPDSCREWAFCDGGKVIESRKCKDGYLFDSRKGMCAKAEKVVCKDDKVDKNFCKGRPEGFLQYPGNCKKYIYCTKDGETQTRDCGHNQNYDPTKNICDYVPCKTGSICEYVPDGQFVQDKTACAAYSRCYNGGNIPGKCKAGYWYDRPRGMCNYPRMVPECTEVPIKPGPEPSPVDCAQGKGYYSDGQTCNGYYYCSEDPTAKALFNTCPAKTHFNPDTQTCVNTDQVQCKFNRCDGIDKGWVAIIDSDCKQFDICTKGRKPYPSSQCSAPGYPYFDEVGQSCTSVKPDYPICQTTIVLPDPNQPGQGGSSNSGDGQDGSSNSGDGQGGSSNSGDGQGGSSNSGDGQGGSSNTDNDQGGSSNPGSSGSGSANSLDTKGAVALNTDDSTVKGQVIENLPIPSSPIKGNPPRRPPGKGNRPVPSRPSKD